MQAYLDIGLARLYPRKSHRVNANTQGLRRTEITIDRAAQPSMPSLKETEAMLADFDDWQSNMDV